MTLNWAAPATDGGLPITCYRVTPYISGVAQAVVAFATAATSELITGLTNGTTYTFTVAAVNAAGIGAQSAPSSPQTPTNVSTVPGAPTIGTATAGDSQVELTWTALADSRYAARLA